MHDGTKVVIATKTFQIVSLLKVIDSAGYDIVGMNSDVFVTVRTTLFMVKTKSMNKFVLYDSLVNTSVSLQT